MVIIDRDFLKLSCCYLSLWCDFDSIDYVHCHQNQVGKSSNEFQCLKFVKLSIQVPLNCPLVQEISRWDQDKNAIERNDSHAPLLALTHLS